MLVLLLLFRLILLASISVYFLLQFQLILCIGFSLFFCLNFCKGNVNPRDYKMFWLFFVCSCSLCFSFLFFTVSPSFFFASISPILSCLYLPSTFPSLFPVLPRLFFCPFCLSPSFFLSFLTSFPSQFFRFSSSPNHLSLYI